MAKKGKSVVTRMMSVVEETAAGDRSGGGGMAVETKWGM